MSSGDLHTVERGTPSRASLILALVPGVGPTILNRLVEQFGDSETILNAAGIELTKVDGVGPRLAQKIIEARQSIDVDALLALCRQNRIQIMTPSMPGFPCQLTEIHDPPNLLFAQGAFTPDDALAIAIVGSRHATPYGRRIAARLAAGLATAGYTIVSGLARGIDVTAHRAALEAGGRTIAVLGSGLLNVYPTEHSGLAQQIAGQGAVISEMPPRRPPKSGSFPQRNRIVSGLSLGTVVVEAAERSGALISARLAMEQGREVFAVPGPVDGRMSRGCHQLIRDGATLVENIDDICDELGPLPFPLKQESGETLRHPAELKLNEQESLILKTIDVVPTSIDDVAQQTGIPINRLLATISVLEIRRLIQRVDGTASSDADSAIQRSESSDLIGH